MEFPSIDATPTFFHEHYDELLAMLLPCPFCGTHHDTRIDLNTMWTGRRSSVVSVEVKHWCVPVGGQPSRAIIRVGRTLQDTINAWNQRVTPSSLGVETERIDRAAIWFEGKVYSLPPPARHPDIVRHFGGFGGPTHMGFLTGDNLFVDRAEAMKVAISANQLLAPSDKPYLYTEDLW